MASAAAVAANQARSPSPLTRATTTAIGEDKGLPGEITSGVYSKDDGLPDVNGNQQDGGEEDDDDDDDEELPSNPLQGRKRQRVNGHEGEKAGVEDLFGDDEEEAPERPARRQLDDEELDSGDDVDRTDRAGDEEEAEQQQEFTTQEKVTMDLEVPRQAGPEPSDGEMYLLKLPTFMAIQPQAWDHIKFQPPTTDHHSHLAPSQTFSAYNTALSTIRWRHSPSSQSPSSQSPTSHSARLQSNARINRWADGTLTLQLASDPSTHYEIDGNALAPPQRNPLKPTPTSIQTSGGANAKGGRNQTAAAKDAYTFLLRPHMETSTMLVTHKLTAGLSIKPSGTTADDDAIERLQASLAAAANANKTNVGSGGIEVLVDEDPEKAKQEALNAVRQQERADKRREAAVEREAARAGKVLGSRGRGAGLNVGMLEDEDGEGGGRARPSPNKARNNQQRRRGRRNSEYSEDEDFGRKRFGAREDEYEDEGDDFLAPSDEEEEEEGEEEDPDDGIVEEPRGGKKVKGKDRERTPKRGLEEEDDEADAPGEEEDESEVQAAANRTKRRRVVDEDEDEE